MRKITFNKKFNKKKCIWILLASCALLLALLLQLICNALSGGLEAQQEASRWSADGDVAQVSIFFPAKTSVTEDMIKTFEHSLDTTLETESITIESENAGARLWADAYSAPGTVTLSRDSKTLTADAIGIGGDFFLFHPLKLLSGSYFSGNDLMQDYCILDQDAAWQLFGSNDIVGMTVYIGGVPHIVTGVVERESGKLETAAGLGSTIVYVSYSTLETYGTAEAINHYEIVMPNPVSNYALTKVKDFGVDEKVAEYVENSNRYSFLNRIKTLGSFFTRSMNGKAIIYPYWENIARAYEDIEALLTLLMLVLIVFALVVYIVLFTCYWKHKGWTIHEKRLIAQDKVERYFERKRMQKAAYARGDFVMEEFEESSEAGAEEAFVEEAEADQAAEELDASTEWMESKQRVDLEAGKLEDSPETTYNEEEPL